MEILLLKPDSKELAYVWGWLDSHPINADIEEPSVAMNPLNDHKWAYIWSYRQNGKVVHLVRHRSHPNKDNEKVEFCINASEDMCEADIFKILSVK